MYISDPVLISENFIKVCAPIFFIKRCILCSHFSPSKRTFKKSCKAQYFHDIYVHNDRVYGNKHTCAEKLISKSFKSNWILLY